MSKVIIIAEAGVNHNGDIQNAFKLIEVAAAAGADYVKFQTFKTELNISTKAPKADYQLNNTGNTESQFEMVKKLELAFDDFVRLKKYCEELNIGFLSTAFDNPSIDFIDSSNPDYFKVPSGELTNKPFLQYLASKGRKLIISTGMADMSEISWAVDVLKSAGTKESDLILLHCNTEYPTPMKDVNLLAMNAIKKQFNLPVGYSDHTLGIEVPIAAVALGATVIEKHFTLSREMEGPDHIASLEPEELKQMVHAIRNIELAISGSGIKEPSESEQKNSAIARKSIHAGKDLVKGHKLMLEDVVMQRPGDGISPKFIDDIIGKTVQFDVKEGSKLRWEDVK